MTAKIKISTILSIAFILLFANLTCFAQWSNNPAINNAICNAIDGQFLPKIISDDSGGAIITWTDNRSGTNDIYAQRINAAGFTQWISDGIAVTTAVDIQNEPNIVADGSGGAIITWQDKRNGINKDIYAQRINGAGLVQWTNDGVTICAALNDQLSPEIISDGSGGAIITWQDQRNGISDDIFSQRINAAGLIQWTIDGVAICTATELQNYSRVIPDGSGGAIISWFDFRSGTSDDIYTQRINAAGIVQWANDGVVISSAINYQVNPILVSDGSGGAIITWEDHRSATESDIYAQHINAVGLVQWTTDGIAICTAPSDQYSPAILSDNTGGAIITWYDYRSGTNDDIYSQRINSAGLIQWTNNGVAICTALNDQYYPITVSDGNSGAIITWQDYRGGSFSDIYAQLINAAGQVQWANDGVPICTAINSQVSPAIVFNNNGGAIITWQDGRSSTGDDIYAQQINSGGNISDGIQSIINTGFISIFPNPTNGLIVIHSSKDISEIKIINALGDIVYNTLQHSNKMEIDMTDLTEGFYMLTVMMSDKSLKTMKVVKE